MRSPVVLALVMLPLAACVRVATVRLTSAQASVPVDSVRVFATQAPSDYTELAVLRSVRFFASDGRTLSALRNRAAQLGANGLLLLNTRGPGGVHGTGTGVIIGGRRNGQVITGTVDTDVDEFERAVAIRYVQR